jgi:hypothetical protein
VTQAAFGKRLTGDTIAIPTPVYQGEFDCIALAKAAPLPDGAKAPGPYNDDNPTPLYRSHKRAFDQLRSLFEDEWTMHEHARAGKRNA